MKEFYEAPELNLISYVPAENLAASFGFDDLKAGMGNQNQAPIESSDISFDF